jgi:imidazolonepropionase-like amidohydrolase
MRKVRRTLLANLYAGVTTVLDMGASHRWVVDVRNRVNNDEILGPRMHVVGAPLTQKPTGWGGIDPNIIGDYDDIPDYVSEYERDGIKMIKLYRGISVQVARRVIEEAHKRGMKTVADLWSMNLDAIWMRATGLDGWAHLGGPHVLPKAVFDMMKKDGRFIVTTVTLGEALAGNRITEDKDKSFLRNPLVADIYGRKEVEKYYANTASGREYFYDGKDSFYQSQGFGEMLRYRKNFLINVKQAYDAGVLLAGGTDAPYLGLFFGEAMHRELELLVEAGIPPLDAIKICTNNGAKVLEISDKTGSLKAGMDADILVVKGDPSKNISDTRNIHHVFKQGKLIDRAAIKIE